MIKIEDIDFTEEMIKGGGKFILVKAIPYYGEGDGLKERERIGTRVTVALSGRQLEKIDVLVKESVACSAFNASDLQEISFNDFSGQFVLDTLEETYTFLGKASRFVMI